MLTTEIIHKNEKVVISAENKLIWEDVKRAAQNALWFATPLLLLALYGLQQGREWKEILPLVYGAAIQLAIDLLKKWQSAKAYVVEK